MIIVWIAILILLGLFGYWLLSSSNRYNRELIQRAKEAEETQKYEDAILLYGQALQNYYKPAETCRGKILELWTQHGPFDFVEARQEIETTDDQDREGNLSLFDEVTEIIRQVAAGGKERRKYET